MIATHNQSANNPSLPEHDVALSTVKSLKTTPSLLLSHNHISHHPKAGLNPLVDAAAYLFSIIGKLKQVPTYRQLNNLQRDLIQEINAFQEAVKHYGYNADYIVICQYTLCAALDDIISNTTWGGQGQWEGLSLLSAFNLDIQHQDKFFTIMERAIKEPALYIDLMELMYLCLSMGYKGQYRSTEHNHYQLEQITNNLYKHIRAYRGSFSKTLSPTMMKPLKSTPPSTRVSRSSLVVVFFATACIIMTIFVSLGYLMDIITNEAYKHITPMESTRAHTTT